MMMYDRCIVQLEPLVGSQVLFHVGDATYWQHRNKEGQIVCFRHISFCMYSSQCKALNLLKRFIYCSYTHQSLTIFACYWDDIVTCVACRVIGSYTEQITLTFVGFAL